MSTPAGWYPDPAQDGQIRYWDGDAWTEYVAVAADSVRPPAEAPGARDAVPPASAPTTPTPGSFGSASPATPPPGSLPPLGAPAGGTGSGPLLPPGTQTWPTATGAAPGGPGTAGVPGGPGAVVGPWGGAPWTARGGVSPAGLRTLGMWVAVLLFASAAVALLAAMLGAGANAAYEDRAGRSRDFFQAHDAFEAGLGFLVLGMVVTAIVWAVWANRTHKQLFALRGTTGRHSPGMAGGCWFIPIGVWWLGKQVIDDQWRLTDPTPAQARVPGLVHTWWGFFLAGWILLGVSSSLTPTAEMADPPFQAYYTTGMFGSLLLVVAGILGGLVVLRLRERTAALATMAGWYA